MATSNRCRLCSSTVSEALFRSRNQHGRHIIDRTPRFNLRRCRQCDAVYIAGLTVNESYFRDFYETGYYNVTLPEQTWGALVMKAYESASLRRKAAIIRRHIGTLGRKIRILDVGCGGGAFLASLDGAQFRAAGVEINKEGWELCRSKGLTVYNQDIHDIDFGKTRFDVITLWHVVEHLEHPVTFFKRLHQILAPRGIIVCATPSTDSLGFRIGGADWFHLDSPRHLTLFNRESLRRLGKETGLRVAAVYNEWYDYPLDLWWSVRRSPWKWAIRAIYPLAKLFDTEAVTVIYRKPV